MGPLDEIRVHCPYCGAGFTALIDTSAGDQQYVEDCYACCSPIDFHVVIDHDSGEPTVQTHRQ